MHRLGLAKLEAAVGETWWRQTPNSSAWPSGALLGLRRFTCRTISRAMVWNCFLLLVNAVKGISATSASETQHSSSSSQTAALYSIGVQASSAMFTMASRTVFLTATAREKQTPAVRLASTTLWEKYAESARTMIWAVIPIARTVARASRSRLAAPLPENPCAASWRR
ncbi:hypothetical protein ABZ504_42670 [Streptomyces mirabilis]|uniref:hypothetical protein n=1 Tax=Streptomyces mirabilis TaxID=68239 RepID=UPI0033E1DBDE